MKKLLIFALVLIFLTPSLSIAADMFFAAEKDGFGVGEEFLVEVFLDTKDLTLNATEGAVSFFPEILELKEIRDGNSVINLWIKKPSVGKSGKVEFSGITTGGFSGSRVFLFSMVFEAKREGVGSFAFENLQVLRNDGVGSRAPLTQSSFSYTILPVPLSEQADLSVIDNDPPESFMPSLARDPELYDGQYFVVWSTVDKGSGIDRYEVREGFLGEYVVAESPYVLKDQRLEKNIYIRAIDKAGNKRMGEVKALHPNSIRGLEVSLVLGILLLACLYILKKILSKFSQK